GLIDHLRHEIDSMESDAPPRRKLERRETVRAAGVQDQVAVGEMLEKLPDLQGDHALVGPRCGGRQTVAARLFRPEVSDFRSAKSLGHGYPRSLPSPASKPTARRRSASASPGNASVPDTPR